MDEGKSQELDERYVEVRVLIYDVPLKEDLNKVKQSLSDDELLKEAIEAYAEELISQDIEVWEYEDNMIVTEDGYKIAVYEAHALKYIEENAK
jgi:hypothetical protein